VPSEEVPSEEDSDEQLGEEPGEDHLVDGISAEAEPGDRFADDAASDQAELEAEFAAEELVDGGVDELDVGRTLAAVGPTEPIVEIVPAPPPPPPLASKFDPELVAEAEQLVVEFRRASANFLRRRLRISLDESLDLLQELARRGVIDCEVGSAQGRLVARD
jgi:DNA segregation ATPase FtsK/SpoIIIE-like protein